MEAHYGKRLSALAAGLPAEARVIGLVGVGDRAEAAALAADLAAAVAERRAGHTVLVSLEGAPAALDHEVGAEGGRGLSDVLRGREALAGVAALGRARGFIYVPAGADPIPADRLLKSRGWESLSSSATARGATLLLFLPPETAPSGLAGRVDGVVWLGEPRARGSPEATGAAGARPTEDSPEDRPAPPARDPAPVLGRLEPPAPEAEPAAEGRPPARGAPVILRDPRRGRRRPARPAAPPAGKEGGPRLPRSRRRERPRRRAARLAGLILALLVLAALAAGVWVFGFGGRLPFLPGDGPPSSPAPQATPDTGTALDTTTSDGEPEPGRDALPGPGGSAAPDTAVRRYFSIGARTRFPHSVHEPS